MANEKKAVNCFAKYRKISYHQNIRISSVHEVDLNQKKNYAYDHPKTIQMQTKGKTTIQLHRLGNVQAHNLHDLCTSFMHNGTFFRWLYSIFGSLFYAMWCMCLRLREYLISLAYAIENGICWLSTSISFRLRNRYCRDVISTYIYNRWTASTKLENNLFACFC